MKKQYDVFTKVYKDCTFLEVATYLDPRFAHTNDAALNNIIKLDALTFEVSSESTPSATQSTPNALQNFFDEIQEDVAHCRDINDEFIEYAAEKKIPLNVDPLTWWNKKQLEYPHLAEAAKKYLCATASSVPSERVFSASGRILTSARYSLSDEHVEQLTFLTKNKNIVPW